MLKNGMDTRERLLDAAEQLYLERGYGATSVEAVVEAAGLTKGALFHHFASKHDLALALIERYARSDRRMLEQTVARAERLSRDRVQQVLLMVGLAEEALSNLPLERTGCLFASFGYQAALFDEQVHALIHRELLVWREIVASKIRVAMAEVAPPLEVSAEELADGLVAAIEGGFVLARAMRDASLLPRQVRQYRNYLELLFGVATRVEPPLPT
jgi:TetR/AcrR family transcriptional repressor of nem operon